MIRKPPLRTYQKKKTGQSSFCYSQSSLSWEPRSYSKKIFTDGRKTRIQPPQDDSDSTGFLESTFDRIAKDVRLPPPPQQESNNSINISSDGPLNEPSPFSTNEFEYPRAKDPIKTRATKRGKRKPGPSRTAYADTEVIVKKRLKNDLINTSTKKDKAVRNSRRKVPKENAEEKVNAQNSTPNNSVGWFVVKLDKSSKAIEKRKKQRNRYLLRRKKNEMGRISSSSSSSDSDGSRNQSVDVFRAKTESKKKNVGRHKAERKKLEVFDSVGHTSSRELNESLKFQAEDEDRGEKRDSSIEVIEEIKKEKSSLAESDFSLNSKRIGIFSNKTRGKPVIRNSPALEYVRNFRRYCTSKSKENNDVDSVGSHDYGEISTGKQCTDRMQSELTKGSGDRKPTETLDNLDNSETSKNYVSQVEDLANAKSSPAIDAKCDENQSLILNGEKSVVASHQNYNMHSSADIFQSSTSNAASNLESETCDAIEVRLHESVGTRQAQSTVNESDFHDNLDLSSKRNRVKITGESIERKQRCNSNRSLRYLKCSTPINSCVKINGTINCLSPITSSGETLRENKKFVDKKEASCIANNTRRSRRCSNLPKTNMRRKSARKRLSVSYEEDESSEISNEYRKENKIEKIPAEHGGNCEYSSHQGSSEKIKSPTSQIQESLEILKLNLENSDTEYNKDDKNKRRLARKAILPTKKNVSDGMFDSTNKYDDTDEFTGRSKNTCSQLTPAGIITTRSGRQLKLSMTTQREFFNDSNDSKIHSDTEDEIINDSESARCRLLKDRITERRRRRFVTSSSHSNHSTSEDVKNSNSTESDLNVSIARISENSITHESTNLNILQKSETIPLRRRSKRLTENYGREFSRIDDDTSVAEDDGRKTSNSSAADVQKQYSTLSTKEISQSITESTKNLDSLNIRSPDNVTTENLGTDNDEGDSEWTTLSGSVNFDSTTSILEEKMREESHDGNELTNSSLNSGKGSNETSYDTSKLGVHPSPQYTELPLTERMKFLSNRINTRKRRKTFSKSITETLPTPSEELAKIQTSVHRESTNSIIVSSGNELCFEEDDEIETEARSIDRKKNSDSVKEPLYNNLPTNLQPVVVLGRLDPSRITTKQNQDQDLKETVIHEESSEASREVEINDIVVDRDSEDLEKSKPSYRPTEERSETDNSASKENIASVSHSDRDSSKLDVRGPKTKGKKSVLATLQEIVIRRSNHEKENSSRESNRSSLRRSEKRNSSSTRITTPELEVHCNAAGSDISNSEMIGRQSLFLKPGKDWTRSLSILNNIQNGSNLEQLSAGKGKNWRQSVQAIFAMQHEGLLQSCLGKNEDDKDTQTCFRALNATSIPETTPCSEEQSIGSASPNRFIRRMSIRVVPDNKRLSNIADTSFLEAYGITPSKSGKTLSRTPQFESGEKTLTRDVQCEDKAIETVQTERIATARDVVLQRCDQDNHLTFRKCFPAEYLKRCKKIGEGVYGEVFLHEHRSQKSVIKIIPIEGDALVNGERQKRFDEILSEIVIAKELHNLRNGGEHQTHGFVEVQNIKCIKGKYPEKLIELWKAYDNDKGSDNDCPSMFDRNQLYIVLELGHGGEDLEAFAFKSSIEAHALFVQAAVALAVAEQSLEFEHRDLHWGNILIKETNDEEVTYKLNNREYRYPTKGLQVAIIDFTLSRMSYDGCCIFNDLALDPALFTAQGEYQFEIYRLMRDKIGNDWQRFEPYTNILWLHYTLDKMITSLRYKETYGKRHREGLFLLHELKEDVLNYKSAFDFVTSCEKITNLQCNSRAETTEEIIEMEGDDRK